MKVPCWYADSDSQALVLLVNKNTSPLLFLSKILLHSETVRGGVEWENVKPTVNAHTLCKNVWIRQRTFFLDCSHPGIARREGTLNPCSGLGHLSSQSLCGQFADSESQRCDDAWAPSSTPGAGKTNCSHPCPLPHHSETLGPLGKFRYLAAVEVKRGSSAPGALFNLYGGTSIGPQACIGQYLSAGHWNRLDWFRCFVFISQKFVSEKLLRDYSWPLNNTGIMSADPPCIWKSKYIFDSPKTWLLPVYCWPEAFPIT